MGIFLNIAALLNENEVNIPKTKADQASLNEILTIIFTIIGALALLVIVIAGFRYAAAQGDPQKVAAAKNQILYAAIGLIVAISAATIVNFVIGSS